MISPTPLIPPATARRPDDELVTRARAGDRAAFGALYAKHVNGIYNMMLRMIRSAPEAEELTQEAFFQAFKCLPEFEGRSSFLTWLFRIATNVALMYRKRCARSRRWMVLPGPNDDDPVLDAICPAPGPPEQAERRLLLRALVRAIDRLPPTQRVAVVLGPVQGRTYEEIGEILGIPVDAVKGRLHRARVRLKRHLSRTSGLPSAA